MLRRLLSQVVVETPDPYTNDASFLPRDARTPTHHLARVAPRGRLGREHHRVDALRWVSHQ